MNEQQLSIFDKKLDKESSQKVCLLKDFINYLSYLKERPAKLTATGNLSLKVIGETSQFIKKPQHFIEHGFPIRNQQDWWYLDELVVLAEVGRLTAKRKGFKRLSPRGREYLSLLPTSQLGELFMIYWERLHWGFLFPFGPDDATNPAVILRHNHQQLAEILLDFKKDKDGWIAFSNFTEYVIKLFDLKLYNCYGESLPSRVNDCIVDVLLEPFYLFGLIEIQGKVYDSRRIITSEFKAFRLTRNGSSMLNIIVPPVPPADLVMPFINLN